MDDDLEQELKDIVDRMEPAERNFVLAIITGEGFDEAFDALKEVRGVE